MLLNLLGGSTLQWNAGRGFMCLQHFENSDSELYRPRFRSVLTVACQL